MCNNRLVLMVLAFSLPLVGVIFNPLVAEFSEASQLSLISVDTTSVALSWEGPQAPDSVLLQYDTNQAFVFPQPLIFPTMKPVNKSLPRNKKGGKALPIPGGLLLFTGTSSYLQSSDNLEIREGQVPFKQGGCENCPVSGGGLRR